MDISFLYDDYLEMVGNYILEFRKNCGDATLPNDYDIEHVWMKKNPNPVLAATEYLKTI